MRCQKSKCLSVPFAFTLTSALKLVALGVASFPQLALPFCRLDLGHLPDTDGHSRIGLTHDDKSLQGLLGRDPVVGE